MEYLWDHQIPVSFIWHLSSCFISANGLFPLSIPAAQKNKPEGYWLLFTNQPHIFFSHCAQSLVRFLFFFPNRNRLLWSLGKTSKWGNNVCIHTVFSLQPYTGAGCPPEIYLHFCVMYDNKQILSSKRSYQGSLLFAFDDGKKQRQLTMSSSSWYNYVWTCLSFKLLTEQSVRLCITDFYKNVQPCKCINCRVFV